MPPGAVAQDVAARARRRPRDGRLAPDDRAPRAATPTRRCRWRRERHEVRRRRHGRARPSSTRYAVGVAAWRLGAGRARKEDPVQAGAGIELHAKPGDAVREGDLLLTLHTDEPERFDRAQDALQGAVTIAPRGHRRRAHPLVIDRIA